MTSVPPSTRDGEYVDAGGLRTYYEASGEGEPLLLLHGGFCTVETFDGLTPMLAEAFRVYVPERRGHGRTPDVEGPITFVNMAQDTIAFMDALDLGSAHVVGWSDGATVGLHVALERPDRVRKLVLIGMAVNHDGYPQEARDLLKQATPETVLPPFLRDLYANASPDGAEHFDVVFERLVSTWQTEPSFALSDLEGLTMPTLVMVAEHDLVTVEHAAAMQRAIPDAQLAVVPGADHGFPMQSPALASEPVVAFLSEDR